MKMFESEHQLMLPFLSGCPRELIWLVGDEVVFI